MNIAICDDDRVICGFFEEKIKAVYPNADIESFYDGDTFWHMAKKEPEAIPDILLLDIQMKNLDGMELARKLRGIGWKSILIFITAYADYVFDAFDVGAFHYLVKPVSDEKLEKVLRKAEGQLRQEKEAEQLWQEKGAERLQQERGAWQLQQENAAGQLWQESAGMNRSREKRITVKRAGVHTTVKASDIIYAEVFNRKVVLHTTTEDIEYYGKLKSLEDELGNGFYRPHRAYLVNLKYVVKYDSSAIFLQKGQVMMAKQNYADFVKVYMSYMKREYGGFR